MSPSDHGINALDEISSILIGNEVNALTGVVTRRDLERELESRPYDVIHFAQHGNSGVLHMSDGPVTVEWLTRRIARQSSLKLVFINACDSIETGAAIHNATGCVVISYARPISDRVASRFAEDVYGAIRSGASVHSAFYEALASAQRIFPEEEVRPILIDGHSADWEDRIRRLEKEVSELREIVSAHSRRIDTAILIIILLLEVVNTAIRFV